MPKKLDSVLFLKKLKASWRRAFLRLIPLGGFSANNEVKFYHSGDDAFLAIFNEIRKAKESIFIETYILSSDRVGVWLSGALLEARERGVSITVLYDHLGSGILPQSFLSPLIKAGIKVMAFNPIWPWRKRGPLIFRDHRKIMVMDEKVAFCGSMNISADYAGPIFGNDRYRDSIARIEGPAVLDLLAITLESIKETEFEKRSQTNEFIRPKIDKSLAIKLFLKKLFFDKGPKSPTQFDEDKGTLVQVLRSNMRRNLAHIQKSMEESINRAVSYCYLTTPYFLPHQGLRKALIHAKKRGVDIRILTAGSPDVPLMRYASRHVYMSLLKEGVRIYEMTQKALHAKLSTIDGIHSSIGSYNLDHWSARRNLEVNLAIIDQDIALKLKEQFKTDLKLSKEVNKIEFLSRSKLRQFLCWLAYLLHHL